MKEIEFLPERIRHRRRSRGRLVRTGWLLGVCLLGMTVLTYVRHCRIARASGEYAELADRAVNVQRQVDMIAPLQRQLADLLIKKRIDGELGSRTDCTAVLAELCRVTPPNLVLVSLELKPVEIRQTRAASERSTHRSARATAASSGRRKSVVVRRQRLVITGMAPTDVDVANFIGQLSASCLFQDVNMGYARTVAFRKRVAREFQASCYLAK